MALLRCFGGRNSAAHSATRFYHCEEPPGDEAISMGVCTVTRLPRRPLGRLAMTMMNGRLLRRGAHRDMRLQEGAHLADDALPELLGLAPRVDRDLGVRRQRGDVDRGLQRVRRRVVGEYEHRRVAVLDELARHAVEEIGQLPPQAVEILV